MKIWETDSGYEIFRVLSGRSNSYFISAAEQNILVDAGNEAAYTKLKTGINSLYLLNRKISFLILTHTHFDHCQNAAKLKEEENCKIIISIKGKEDSEQGYSKLPKGILPATKPITFLGNLIGKKRFGYKSFDADIFVKDEFDFINYNLKIMLMKTAGHSPDSISVIVDDEVAIVGDAMFGIFRNSILPPFADNPLELIDSWKRLLDTGCNIFLPGHGREIKRELLKKEYDKYKERFKKK
jgi:hydroxyacylglutathione hydrolase